ncbi:MAG: CHAD domain-containing protein, partial [Burkholderiaceae bacterium]|nr:CHAD domain-containing protein [Burkholderiaceae bacterium]
GKTRSWPVVTAAALSLPQQITVTHGLQAIVANCLAHIRGNEAGVAHGNNAEGIHQMRVGLRRLNSALGLFRERLRCPQKVLADETLAGIPRADIETDGVMSLRQAISARVYQNSLLVQEAVMSARYRECLLNLEHWVAGLDKDASDTALSGFAQQVLPQLRERLRKRGSKLVKGNPKQRHRARMAAKKVRYATEFFRAWYSPAEVRAYLNALAILQDALGWLNDAAVAEDLLSRLAREQPELAHSVGFVQGYLTAHSRRRIRRLGKLWERFQQLPVPT